MVNHLSIQFTIFFVIHFGQKFSSHYNITLMGERHLKSKKVKLSMCLTKHHSMKMYLFLN
jgi:hypothetical protein